MVLINTLMPLFPAWVPPSQETTQKLTNKGVPDWSMLDLRIHNRQKMSFPVKFWVPSKDFLTSGCVPLSSWVSEPKCLQVLLTRVIYTHRHTNTHTYTWKHNKHTRLKYREGALRVHWSVWGVGMSKEDVRLFRSFSPGLHKLIPEAGWKETAERNQRKQKMKA